MINLNFTLVVQLLNFLILLVVLNFLLFRPILRVLDEREKVVRESREIKEKFTRMADEGIARYERQVHDAKQDAMNIRTTLRSQVMAEFRKQVLEAKGAGLQGLEEARQEIAREAEESRKELMSEAGELGSLIASRLAGRKL